MEQGHFRNNPPQLAAPRVLRVVHSVYREQRFPHQRTWRDRVPKELFNHRLSAYERDYLNWYHGDPLRISPSQARTHSANHRAEVMASGRCGCFRCGAHFSPKAITQWVRDSRDDTAFCPACDIDAVIGDASGYPLDADFLEAMGAPVFG